MDEVAHGQEVPVELYVKHLHLGVVGGKPRDARLTVSIEIAVNGSCKTQDCMNSGFDV